MKREEYQKSKKIERSRRRKDKIILSIFNEEFVNSQRRKRAEKRDEEKTVADKVEKASLKFPILLCIGFFLVAFGTLYFFSTYGDYQTEGLFETFNR